VVLAAGQDEVSGHDNVLKRITGQWPLTPVFQHAGFGPAQETDDTIKLEAEFPPMGAAPQHLSLTFSFNGSDKIKRVEQQQQAAPPQPPDAPADAAIDSPPDAPPASTAPPPAAPPASAVPPPEAPPASTAPPPEAPPASTAPPPVAPASALPAPEVLPASGAEPVPPDPPCEGALLVPHRAAARRTTAKTRPFAQRMVAPWCSRQALLGLDLGQLTGDRLLTGIALFAARACG